MKYIEIKTCTDCSHCDHTGAFTKGGAKPCCNHDETVRTKGNDCFNRVIPYKTDYDRMRPTRVPKRIPEIIMKTKLMIYGMPIVVTLLLLYCFFIAATLATIVISAVLAICLFFWWIAYVFYHSII